MPEAQDTPQSNRVMRDMEREFLQVRKDCILGIFNGIHKRSNVLTGRGRASLVLSVGRLRNPIVDPHTGFINGLIERQNQSVKAIENSELRGPNGKIQAYQLSRNIVYERNISRPTSWAAAIVEGLSVAANKASAR